MPFILLAIILIGCAQRQTHPQPSYFCLDGETNRSNNLVYTCKGGHWEIVDVTEAALTLEKQWGYFMGLVAGSKIYQRSANIASNPFDDDLYFYKGVEKPEIIAAALDAVMARLTPLLPGEPQRPRLFHTVVVPAQEPDTPEHSDGFWADTYDPTTGHILVTGMTLADMHDPWVVYLVDWQYRGGRDFQILMEHEFQHLVWSFNDVGGNCLQPDGHRILLSSAIGHGGPCDPLTRAAR